MHWLLTGLIFGTIAPGWQDRAASAPMAGYQALLEEYRAAEFAWTQRYGNGAQGDPQAQIVARYRDWPAWEYAPRFARFATEHADDPAAKDALLWLADLPRQVGAGDAQVQEPLRLLFELMARPRFRDDDRLVEGCRWAFRYPSPWTEAFLRATIADSPRREVRGLAALFLAGLLEQRRQSAVDPLSDRDGLSPFETVLRQRQAPEFIAYLKATDMKGMDREVRQLLDRVIREYGDVTPKEALNPAGKSLAELARRKLELLAQPDRGRTAPDIDRPDADGRPLKLSSYRGKVVLLAFVAPRDPQSREHLATLRKLAEQHRDEPFALLGVACEKDAPPGTDSLPGHYWEDGLNGPIADAWGVNGPTFFVIDPDGTIVDLHRGVSGGYLERSVERRVRIARKNGSR